MTLRTLVWLPLLLVAACRSAPIAPIPAPLPEALPWEAPMAEGAFLGLDTEENSGDSLDSLTFEPGVRVVSVANHSPAAAAGVRVGDVVLAVDGREIDDPGALDALIERAGAGSEVVLDVLRGDAVTEVRVVIAAPTGAASQPPRQAYLLDPTRSRAGWSTDRDGVRLVTTAPDGPFAEGDFPVGTVVLTIDGEGVASDRELIRRLQAMPAGRWVRVSARRPDGELIDEHVRLHAMPRRVTRWGVPILMGGTAEPDGSAATFSFIDIWFFQLFQYHRDRNERTWILLELFGWELFPFATGVGELTE